MTDPATLKWIMAGLLAVAMLFLCAGLLLSRRRSVNSSRLHRHTHAQRRTGFARQHKEAKRIRNRMDTDQIVEGLNDVFGKEQ